MINFDFIHRRKFSSAETGKAKSAGLLNNMALKVLLHYGQSSIKSGLYDRIVSSQEQVLRLWNWEESNRIPKFPW